MLLYQKGTIWLEDHLQWNFHRTTAFFFCAIALLHLQTHTQIPWKSCWDLILSYFHVGNPYGNPWKSHMIGLFFSTLKMVFSPVNPYPNPRTPGSTAQAPQEILRWFAQVYGDLAWTKTWFLLGNPLVSEGGFNRKITGCSKMSGWWWLEHVLFFHILGIVIPIDELIFFRGVQTTNQMCIFQILPCLMTPEGMSHE